MSETLQSTPLIEEHRKLGAKLVGFGGWLMPVSYESVLSEHHAVRTGCGIFDVSHMGEVFVTGPDAKKFLQFITINDIEKLKPGLGQYSAILNELGGMIDDLIIYQLATDDYLVCVNASNIEKDFTWIKMQASNPSRKFNCSVKNVSDEWSQIAVQGPESQTVISAVFNFKDDLPYTGICSINWKNQRILLARTGYTGEFGYEVYLPNALAAEFWNACLASKSATTSPVKPCGLGARDTLRLEACYLLYGNDMDENVTPLEAGIGWATKLNKPEFIGRAPLVQQKESLLERSIRAFVMKESGIPRHGMKIFHGDQEVGVVTSGSVLPTVGGAGGMAMIQTEYGVEGKELSIDVRGAKKQIKIAKRPLYQARTK